MAGGLRRVTDSRVGDLNSSCYGAGGHLLHLPDSLCPLLFTARDSGRVNYGEVGFHKFHREIWSDKFKSQDPASGSRAHTSARACAR